MINNKTQTLTSDLKTFDGGVLDLSSSWNLQNNFVPEIIEDSLKLIYTKKLLNRYPISKSLTFYSDSYKILCELDLRMVPRDLIENNVTISWFGGLKPTEQNIDDDQLYFQIYSFLGGEKETFKVKENKPEFFTYNGALEWGAIRTKYFTLAFLPKDPNSIRKTIVSGLKQDSSEVYNLSMVSSASEKAVFHMYLGPLEYDRIKEVGQGLEGIMDFGWSPVRPISKAVLLTLTKMHEYIPNYGYILVLFSLLIKIVVYPLTKKSLPVNYSYAKDTTRIVSDKRKI